MANTAISKQAKKITAAIPTSGVDRTKLRKQIKQNADKVESLVLTIARDLFIVKMGGLYKDWGYDTFNSYVANELPMGKRSVEYYCAVYKQFILNCGVDGRVLKSFNMSQLKSASSVVTPKNVGTVLEAIRGKNARDTQTIIARLSSRTRENSMTRYYRSSIQLPKNVVVKARKAANKIGVSTAEFMEMLITSYTG